MSESTYTANSETKNKIEHNGYYIKAVGKDLGMYSITSKKGGLLPNSLIGCYTTVGLAKEFIDAYVRDKVKETNKK